MLGLGWWSVPELFMSCTSCGWNHPTQASNLQGHYNVNCGDLVANDLGNGWGWQQSKQDWALLAVVGQWTRMMCNDLCWVQSAPQPLFARAWKVLAARQRWREGQPGGRESKTQVADASERGRWRENKKIQTLLRAKKTLGIPSRFVRVNLAQGPCLSSLCRSRVTPQPLFCAWKVLVVRRRWSEGDPGGGRVRRRCEWKCKGKMLANYF